MTHVSKKRVALTRCVCRVNQLAPLVNTSSNPVEIDGFAVCK